MRRACGGVPWATVHEVQQPPQAQEWALPQLRAPRSRALPTSYPYFFRNPNSLKLDLEQWAALAFWFPNQVWELALSSLVRLFVPVILRLAGSFLCSFAIILQIALGLETGPSFQTFGNQFGNGSCQRNRQHDLIIVDIFADLSFHTCSMHCPYHY